ncbi:MAG: hypothetical protein ACP5HQ_03295 [Thermoprotei archaeon]
MSQRPNPRPQVSISIKSQEPMDIVRTVLERNHDYFLRQIRSESSYRKIHEMLATILDTAEGMKDEEAVKFLKEQLPRAYLIIEYQNVRGQIYDDLKKILIDMINDLLNAPQKEVKILIRKARLLIDSLAVVAKEVG